MKGMGKKFNIIDLLIYFLFLRHGRGRNNFDFDAEEHGATSSNWAKIQTDIWKRFDQGIEIGIERKF